MMIRQHPSRLIDTQARRIMFAIMAGICAALPAAAQTAADRSSVRVAIERFEAAFDAGEYGALLTAMPPPLLEHIASQAGVAPDTLRTQLAAQMTAMMSQMTLHSFHMDVAAAQWGETPSGLTYALVPTETVMSPPGSGRIRSTTTTLALNEADSWFLVRVDNAQQINLLVEVYPEFSSVSFPPGTMEVLD